MRILVDTSAVYAAMDRDSRVHQIASAIWRRLVDQRDEPFFTNFIVCETYALLMSRRSGAVARTWLREQDLPIERVTELDEVRARRILMQYDDKSFSYTDATSFAVMERLGITVAFSFDHDFCQYGGLTVLGCTHA